MTGPVCDLVEGVARQVEQVKQQFDDLLVAPLTACTDEIRLADLASFEYCPNGGTVVVDVDPITNVVAFAVDLRAHAVNQIRDLPRNELLDVLPWTVIVGAVADRGSHAERSHPCPHQKIGPCLGR